MERGNVANIFGSAEGLIAVGIVAHTDDESLGAGGTLARLKSLGWTTYLIAVSDGVASRKSYNSGHKLQRDAAAHRAAEILGANWLQTGTLPDNALDSVPMLKIVEQIHEPLKQIRPDLVLTHCATDLNIDHRRVAEAVRVVFRPEPNRSQPMAILAFEVVSSTHWSHGLVGSDFSPNVFVDISSHYDRKVEALYCYRDEMRPWPHARSMEAVDALSLFRGSTAGFRRAEAFELVFAGFGG